MRVTIGGEAVQHCTPPINSSTTSVLSREYDGISVYSPPSGCSLDYPTLTVVHGDLHTPSCTAEEVANSGDEGLSKAVVGIPANFQVISRDAFGNIRFVIAVLVPVATGAATRCDDLLRLLAVAIFVVRFVSPR